MASFVLALLAFVAAHVVPAAPPVRARLVGALGRRMYLLLYSASSLALLAWIIVAARNADDLFLWDPAPWQGLVPFVAMPFAAFLLAAGLIEPNPLSVGLLPPGDRLPAVACVTRHPVLWAFLLWAGAHVPPNGRLVPVVLFGAMALLAAAGIPLLDRKARNRLGEAEWRALAARTSVLPFAALLRGRAVRPRFGPLLAATGIALLFVLWFVLDGHARLIGVDPLAGLQALGR